MIWNDFSVFERNFPKLEVPPIIENAVCLLPKKVNMQDIIQILVLNNIAFTKFGVQIHLYFNI